MPIERSPDRHIDVFATTRRPDAVIADLAERQHGVVAREQLLALGLTPGRIESRLRAGRLHTVHRGVYAVGHRGLSRHGRARAAVFAAGPGALLSHRAAAWLRGLLPEWWVEVTAPAQRRGLGVVVVHRSSLLPADERAVVNGIPVTTVPRTLLDLAAVVSPRRLERAFEQAEILRMTDALSLPDLMDRYPHRRGIRSLRALLERNVDITRSELERRFRDLIHRSALPRPAFNIAVEGFECDAVWWDQRVIVELDGRETHDTQSAFERDRRRDRVLAAAGWRVVRITWRQLRDEPRSVVADLRRLLHRGVAEPSI